MESGMNVHHEFMEMNAAFGDGGGEGAGEEVCYT